MHSSSPASAARSSFSLSGARVAVTGASGLVGRALAKQLATRGARLAPIVRKSSPGAADEILWNPSDGTLDVARLAGADAVVHLAGENIAGRRWNDAVKRDIRDSRVNGTRLLAESLARLDRKPRVLVSASAIGYYGHRGDALLGEESGPGTGFLSDVCQAWERATEPAERAGIRVVHLRIGVVLTPAGGALQKMLLPFKLGAGGRMGSGGQYWSWISLDDLVGSILHCLVHEDVSGAVNAVAPGTVTNREFTAELAKALHRPAIFPMPAFAARLALGEMADALLLASTRVAPLKLQESGYKFQHPTLAGALAALLK